LKTKKCHNYRTDPFGLLSVEVDSFRDSETPPALPPTLGPGNSRLHATQHPVGRRH
jgi:hypothetical protein